MHISTRCWQNCVSERLMNNLTEVLCVFLRLQCSCRPILNGKFRMLYSTHCLKCWRVTNNYKRFYCMKVSAKFCSILIFEDAMHEAVEKYVAWFIC